jgi:hypothetical protein
LDEVVNGPTGNRSTGIGSILDDFLPVGTPLTVLSVKNAPGTQNFPKGGHLLQVNFQQKYTEKIVR